MTAVYRIIVLVENALQTIMVLINKKWEMDPILVEQADDFFLGIL